MTPKPAPQKTVATKTEPRLGRGLAALFGDADMSYQHAAPATAGASAAAAGQGAASPTAAPTPTTEASSINKTLRHMPIAWLRPGMFQPRRHFDEIKLQELAESIRAKGVLQPLLVRAVPNTPNTFEIVAGERRWHAAQRAGIHEVPVVVRTLSNQEALEIAIIENIQRQDLNPIEEANSFQRLMDEFDYTQDDVAKTVGKSRSYIANTLRLNTLPLNVRTLLSDGTITAGHARTLITAADPTALAEAIVEGKLSVRQAETLLRDQAAAAGKPLVGRAITKARQAAVQQKKDADLILLEKELSRHLGLSVAIAARSKTTGTLSIGYKDLDQLDGILRRLRK